MKLDVRVEHDKEERENFSKPFENPMLMDNPAIDNPDNFMLDASFIPEPM